MRAIDYFDKSAQAFPDRTAIVEGARHYSYREALEITERIARAMWANGLRGDQRAAIHSYNHAEVLLCMLGIFRAGAVWVPINFRNALDANAEFMAYADTEWLFYDSRLRDDVAELKSRVSSLRQLVCINGEDAENPSLTQFMSDGDSVEDLQWADPYGNVDRLMGLVPTGGTTGPAKGVRVTNLAWGTMTEMAARYWRSEETPVCLCTAPLSHAAGVVAFTIFGLGGTNVVMQGFDALQVLRYIELYRVTHLFLPPTAFYALLAHPELRKFDYSSLRIFLLAGSPVSPDKLKRGIEVFGPCMCQSYGQTEAPMLLTWLDPGTLAAAAAGDHPERLASCGKATSAVHLAIMDDAGHILPPNERGEIVARGTLVTAGYHKMPEATAEIRAYGWHHTGDVGYMDEEGYVYIIDRKKDMIITGGFNVYSAEVESGIMTLPGVRECAVIGIPDDRWGEAIKAIVVLQAGEMLSEEEVIEHCKTKLGRMKSPKSIEFWTEIPKTPAGKLDRKAIRKSFWEGAERQVH
jgi:acyl-CoA synthetase (AMP-forming)/AMP-acid ligase II